MKTKLINTATYCTVGLHFITCILPLLLAIFGGTLSFAGFMSPGLMQALLIGSSLLIAFSWFNYFKNPCERSKWQLILLVGVTILFVTSVAIRFLIPETMGVMHGTEKM